jgi:ABC-type iron transport system FetAB ATPase subunit
MCEEDGKPEFDVLEFLEDYLPEGGALDTSDTTKIDGIVNKWIDKHVPRVWIASDERPTLESVLTFMKPREEASEQS